jgi:hypothetical protein
MAAMKRKKQTQGLGEDVKERASLYFVGGKVNVYNHCRKL